MRVKCSHHPAFSQEIHYDLAQDSVIAYKTIRIRVLSASNAEISFEVLDDGGLPWLPNLRSAARPSVRVALID